MLFKLARGSTHTHNCALESQAAQLQRDENYQKKIMPLSPALNAPSAEQQL